MDTRVRVEPTMSLAEEDGIIAATPCRRILLPPVVVDERRYLTATEVERLAEAIRPRYQALSYTASYLGLRWHEIAGLRRRYLQLEQGRPATLRVISTIERSGGRCRVVDLGKTKDRLRHTAAAFMIDDGADPLQLKRRMGDQDIRPSLDT